MQLKDVQFHQPVTVSAGTIQLLQHAHVEILIHALLTKSKVVAVKDALVAISVIGSDNRVMGLKAAGAGWMSKSAPRRYVLADTVKTLPILRDA